MTYNHKDDARRGPIPEFLGSQGLVLILTLLILGCAFIFNIGDLSIQEREVKESPEFKRERVLSALGQEKSRTEIAAKEDAYSPSLQHMTGEGKPAKISGKGSKKIIFEKPDGPKSPAWVEYKIIQHSEKWSIFEHYSIYASTGPLKYGKSYTVDFSEQYLTKQGEESSHTRTGSFWLAGEAEVPIDLSLNPEDTWEFTIHSAKDAPVLRPGDSLAGDLSQGPQAFRYLADRKSRVEGNIEQPTDKEILESFTFDHFSLNLSWIDAESDVTVNSVNQNILSLSSGYRGSKLSQSSYWGSTELLPGEYLMSVQARVGDWDLKFLDVNPKISAESNFSSYALKETGRIDSHSGDGGTSEGEQISFKENPAAPRILHFSAQGPQADGGFSIGNISDSSWTPITTSWSYDDINGYVLLSADELGEKFRVSGPNPWKISTYGTEAIPTYRPGDYISGTGPMLFYLESGQRVRAILERENNGDDNGRSRVKIYSAEGEVDSRPSQEWLELYSTSLSSLSVESNLVAVEEPTLFFFDISPTVSWKLALEAG